MTTLQITLPDDLVARIRAEVEAGTYESESAFVIDSLLQRDAVTTADAELEAWLHREVVPVLERLDAV